MANAIKIQTLDSDNSTILGTLFFERKEAAAGQAMPRVRTAEQVAQNGQPTFLILQNSVIPYRIVNVQFRIHGISTLGKLLTIRDHLLSARLVRVFPKWQSDQSVFYDCFADPASIPEQHFFSGEDRGGEILNLEFREGTLDNQVVAEFDVVVE